jgi:hypothetical protein
MILIKASLYLFQKSEDIKKKFQSPEIFIIYEEFPSLGVDDYRIRP